jgi:hypothetical protein
VERNGERVAKIFARYASVSLPSLQTLASKSGTVALLVDQREVRWLERSGWCFEEDLRKKRYIDRDCDRGYDMSWSSF